MLAKDGSLYTDIYTRIGSHTMIMGSIKMEYSSEVGDNVWLKRGNHVELPENALIPDGYNPRDLECFSTYGPVTR